MGNEEKCMDLRDRDSVKLVKTDGMLVTEGGRRKRNGIKVSDFGVCEEVFGWD